MVPPDVVIRAPRDEDVPALVELNATSADEAGKRTHSTADDVTLLWTAPRFDREQHARVAVDGDRIVATVTVAPHRAYADIRGYTHPAARGRGIGSHLLGWAIEAGRAVPGVSDVYAGTNARFADAIDMIERAGFRYARSFFDMEHPDPTSVREPPPPDGIEITSELRGDALRDAAIFAHDNSFIDHWNFEPFEPAEFDHFMQHPEVDESLFLIATAGDEIAGLNLCFLTRRERVTRGTVGVLGTTRPFRGMGLGTALLNTGVAALAARGATTVDLGVDAENPSGALGLYERNGFSKVRESRVFSMPAG